MSSIDDIAIIGGGLVGLCAALVLQHPGRQLKIIEASQLQVTEASGLNARSIALSLSSVQIFKALQIWPLISTHAFPINNIHISSRGRWGVSRLSARQLQTEALGYVIESHRLAQCLLEAVEANPDIEILSSARVDSLQQDEQVSIGFSQSDQTDKLQARLALIADGANSTARELLGIGQQTIDYRQSVVITNVEVSRPQQGVAYERFTDQGPLAMLPLGENRYSCIWTMHSDQALQIAASEQQVFIDALQSCFGFRLGFIEGVGERQAFPVIRSQADSLVLGRALLIGNAANALHPVAGQSFNLSLRDIAALYELLADKSLAELNNQEFAVIADDYSQQRELEQRKVIQLGDGLISLFSNDLPLLNHFRAAGLGLLDILPSAKAQVAMAGTGMGFAANRLLRGRL